MDIRSMLWIDKYRPKSLDELVTSEDMMAIFKDYITKQEIPNLILYGPPGGGKSTFARILTSKNGLLQHPDDNLLALNGSAKESKGIGYVEDVMEPFLKIPPMQDKFKIVFIDEGDYLTDAALHSLRGIIEKYQERYGRFIITCNYLSKLPEAIQSRFRKYHFKQIPKDFVIEYCKDILEKESIKFDKNDILFIIDSLYPDVRQIIDSLQENSFSGELKVNRNIILSNEKAIIGAFIEMLKFITDNQGSKAKQKISIISQLVENEDINYRNIYNELFGSNIPANIKILINKASNEHRDCFIPKMHFMSLVLDSFTQYKKFLDLSSKG